MCGNLWAHGSKLPLSYIGIGLAREKTYSSPNCLVYSSAPSGACPPIGPGQAGQQTFRCMNALYELYTEKPSVFRTHSSSPPNASNPGEKSSRLHDLQKRPQGPALKRVHDPPRFIRRLIRHNFSKFGRLPSWLTESWSWRTEAGGKALKSTRVPNTTWR